MMVDVDLWCSMEHTRLFLSCANMNHYDTSGIALLEGCKADAAGFNLVREGCAWACKHGRPVARCLWEFGYAGRLLDSRLKHCWLAEACSGSSIDVSVACEPDLMLNVSAEVGDLQADLEAAVASHRAAEQRLAEALAAHNHTKAKFNEHFGNLSAEALAEQRKAEKEELEDAQDGLYLARKRLSGVAAELQETRKHLEANQTLHEARSQSHAEERGRLQGMLSQASEELNKTRDALSAQRSANEKQSFLRSHERRSLVGEILVYEAKWLAEQAAHNATKGELQTKSEAVDEANAWLSVALVALGLVLCLCSGGALFLVIRERKWRSLAISRASNMGAHVVLGRPVGTSGGSEDNATLNGAYPVKPQLAGEEPRKMESTPKAAWT